MILEFAFARLTEGFLETRVTQAKGEVSEPSNRRLVPHLSRPSAVVHGCVFEGRPS